MIIGEWLCVPALCVLLFSVLMSRSKWRPLTRLLADAKPTVADAGMVAAREPDFNAPAEVFFLSSAAWIDAAGAALMRTCRWCDGGVEESLAEVL
jgi:hypothetical protein